MRVWLPVVPVVAATWLMFGSGVVAANAGRQAQDRARKSDETSVNAARIALNEGRYAEVDEALRAAPADDPVVAVLRARAAMATGRDADAIALLKRASTGHEGTDADLELGLLLMRLGRRQEAETLLTPLTDVAGTDTPAELLRAGRAARALGQYEQANADLRQAADRAPGDSAPNVAWGELFLEKHNRDDAKRCFEAAFKADPRSVDAMVGLARTASDDDIAQALAMVRRALTVNPSSVDANLLLAGLLLDAGYPDAATNAAQRAIAVNPRSLDAHALIGAVARLANRQADFDAAMGRVRAIDAGNGEAYRIVASQLAAHYRFDEAVEVARQAVATDPANIRARAELGMDLMRVGDEDGARVELARAFDADRYDLVTYNLLAVLDALKTFETVRDGDIVVRMDRREAPVLAEPALALARIALKDLSSRYGFSVKGPVLIEIFPHHDDFAVRNLGIPGLVDALGACFGHVVTMDSPRARPPGTFDWQATLWHELTHVVTLQMSAQRVPRWLTEGISVYEEQRTRPEWRRPMEAQMARSLDVVPSLRDIESSFADPATIALAYYQAGLAVRYVIETYGQAKFNLLVDSFADGRDVNAAFAGALGAGLGEIQDGFARWLRASFEPLNRALSPVIAAPIGRASLDELKQLAQAHPGNYDVQMALGSALMTMGDENGATQAFRKAATLYPTAQGDDSPHAKLAKMALSQDDTATALAEMGQQLEQDPLNIELARRMAGIMGKDWQSAAVGTGGRIGADGSVVAPQAPIVAQDFGPVRTVYERIAEVDPFDADAHAALGKLAMARADAPTAVREFTAALAANAGNAPAVGCDLAEAYVLAGDAVRARKQTLAVLEQAPTYERAQELLLKLVEAGR